MQISVQITNNGNTNIKNAFVSFVYLNNTCKLKGVATWIHLLQIKRISDKIISPQPKLPSLLPIPEGGLFDFFPWS